MTSSYVDELSRKPRKSSRVPLRKWLFQQQGCAVPGDTPSPHVLWARYSGISSRLTLRLA